jgi:hypothetical protein
MDSYIRTHVNRTGRWIRKHMRGNKEERPEQVRLGEEIMQFLVKRETSLADAVDALTTLMLNVLARNFGKRNEFSRFYERVSTFLGPTERDLAIVPPDSPARRGESPAKNCDDGSTTRGDSPFVH